MVPSIITGLSMDSTGTQVETIEANNESLGQTQVLESNICLQPPNDCLKSHGKGKGRLLQGQESNDPTSYDCGFYLECNEGILFPSFARKADYRLTTDDPIHDLKRWMTTPNQRASGEERPLRSGDAHFFMSSTHYHEEHFRECILWAVQEIKYMHTIIRVQIEYLSALPYKWKFFKDPIGDAMSLGALPTLQTLQGLRRPDLTRLVEEGAIELDYLREQEWFIRKQILQLKWTSAKGGHWGEIAEMLQFGWVNEEHVQKYCCV